MAASISLYNHTAKRFLEGTNAATDTYKINLYSDFVFIPAAVTLDAAENDAVQLESGNGYTADDKALANVVVTQSSNDAFLDADDVIWTAGGGSIEAIGGLIYNATDLNSPPVAWIDFGGIQSAGPGTDFKIIWSENGIIRLTVE